MSKPYAMTFAGVPGSSKSILAYHLSGVCGLPIFSTDNIRFEVKEDLRVSDLNDPRALQEYERRSAARRRQMLEFNRPIILEGSVDRRWPELRQQLHEAGYDWCLISMDLSRDFLVDLYTATGRPQAVEELDAYLAQHDTFKHAYGSDVSFCITDTTFAQRLAVAQEGVRHFTEARL